MKKDYYQILGVERNADDDTIRKAYRKLAKKYHPDVNSGNAAAEEKFKEVTEAYEILGDKEKRAMYDQFGEDAFGAGYGNGAAGGQPGGGYREYHFTSGDGSGVNFEDIFGDIFGGFAGQGFGGGFGSSGFGNSGFSREGFTGNSYTGGFSGSSYGDGFTRGGSGRGMDLTADVELTFEEAAFGGSKRIRLQDHEGKTRTYEIRIPAGIESGKTIRLRGKGEAGSRENGDLLLRVRVKERPGYRREGKDIYTTIRVPFTTAVLGGEITVDTLYGKVRCPIREGTQPGTKIRLRGKGIAGADQPDVRGDQYAVVEIEVPRNVNPAARQKLQEYEQALHGRESRRAGHGNVA